MRDDGRHGGLFGYLTDEVATRLVAALREAHQIGLRTQEASQRSQRYAWGSTWLSRYALVVEHLSDLPGMHAVRVPKTNYQLALVGGRLVVPQHLAESLGDVPRSPQLRGPVLDVVAGRVPVVRADPTLFDEPEPEPEPENEPDPDPEPGPPDGSGLADAVMVGSVSHPGASDLVAVLWGAVDAVDDDGLVTWSPDRLDPDVPRPRRPAHGEVRARGRASR